MTRHRSATLRYLIALLVLPAIFALPLSSSAAAEGEDNCASAPNPIVCENALPGTAPSQWQVQGIGDPTIQGFATSMSVNVGQTESFKIKTEASAYHINILRLGYYGGDGARLVASDITPTAQLPQIQPECLHEPSTGLIDCGDWGVSAQWTVPSNAVSGVYIALLTRNDTGGKSQIIFVVRNDASHSKILLQTSDATWEAYNDYGGNSLYTCTVECPPGNPKAYKGAYSVSYNRPFDGAFTTDNGASYLWYAEYQMMRFLEKNGYDVSYTTEGEVDRNGALLRNHKIFMSSGHDEYWSAGQRANVEAAREAGVNLAFFSANEVFWKTRWGPSSEGSETPYRTLTTYKETHFEGPVDPKDPPTWTGSWRDPRDPASDGGKPENALTGQQFEVNSGTSEIRVPAQYAKLRLWRNTAVANLQPGQTLTLAPEVGTLGYEWDEDVDNGFRPAGEFDLSSTTVSGVQAFTDYGTTLSNNSTATHHLTLYRAPSGALVFGAGTVQWSWGLEDSNAWDIGSTDPGSPPVDPNMQQFTVNLLGEMGATPEALAPGLVAPTPSTDTTPPTSTITAPGPGETFQDGSQVTIAGTATDAGGGVVAGVEVSTDNGATWHPATLTTPAEQSVNWSYTWAAHGYPSTTIKSRAVDDSANLETPAAGVKVNIACPCSIWGNAITPPTPDSGDAHSVEVGVKFSSETFGLITGVRFYKSAANTGTHFGSLWSATGERLAKAEFTGETASGWQQVSFSTPVDVFPNTTYVASYFAPAGHYADSPYYFYTPPPTGGNILNSPPLHALPASAPVVNGLYTSANGVYSYGSTSTFPTSSFQGTNYWVDPVFEPVSAPGQVTNVTATASNRSATVSWRAPASGGPVTTYTITPYIGTEAQPATTITGTPPASSATVTGLTGGTSYTFTVRASNPDGAGATSEQSNAVTPSALAPPSAPTNVTASAASKQALVNWAASTNNGGSAITSYTVTPYIGASAQTPVETGPTATSATVKNLTNGTSYTFAVAANNAVGASPSSASAALTPQDTIFEFATPATVDSGDASATNAGVKFTSELSGNVTGIRFYKAAANTGTHVGSLWSASGTLLAQATFTSETATGWQQVNFSTPVAITANTTYVASYLAPKGHYSDTSSGFATSAANNPPLSALANTTSVNGVYAYSSKSTFPTSTYKATNYWVDVDFEPTPAPGQVTNVSATAGNDSASLTWSAPASGGPVTMYTITPYIGTKAQPATTVSGSPPATGATVTGLADGIGYTFTVQASNTNGSGPVSAESNAIVPSAPTIPAAPTAVSASAATSQALVSWTAPASNGGSALSSYTITPYIGASAQAPVEVSPSSTSKIVKGLTNGASYTFTVTASNAIGASPPSSASSAITPQDTIFDFATPATIDSSESSSIEVGVKFSSEAYGYVTGIRFYKATANTGTHVGSLWSAGGTLLASATFTSETASGWQQVNFSSPILILPNTTYVAGYLAPAGHYSDTGSEFAFSGVSNPPLSALASSTSADGVFAYSSKSVFPTNSAGATNYWVDVDFEPAAVPGQVTNVSATAGNGSASLTWSAPANGGPVTSYTITPYIGAEAQPTTTVTGSPPATGATVTGLNGGSTYTFTVQASNPNGSGAASSPSNAVTPTSITPPSAPTGVTASAAAKQALVSWTASATNGGSALTSYTITPYIGSTAQTPIEASPTATSTLVKGLANGTSYSFTVTANNAIGASAPSSASAAVTPQDTIFELGTPATIDSNDTNSTTVGVKFTAETFGSVTGIRFYKAAANTGTHVGSLWTAGGTLLGSETFTTETASGWQQVNFSSPIVILPNTTYVAGYLAPKGHYSDTVGAFATSGLSNPPLSALANTTSVNGVYAYNSKSVFPTSTTGATNYWVDVDFEPAAVPGQVTNVSATPGNASANVTWSAPASGGLVTSYTITPYIGSEAQTATTITGNPPATGTTITGLSNGTSYTFTVQAANPNGAGTTSSPSSAVTPATTPSAPSEVTASAGNSSATVSWTAPSSNGGSVLTSYTITPYIGSSAQTPLEVSASATSTTVTGLSNGTSYSFTVTATNALGNGPASEHSDAVTPATTPAVATAVTASAANASAIVKWGAPANGGSPLTSYTITPYIGSEAQAATTITGNPPATGTTITGLANGSSYTFTVTASNALGNGPASEHSNAVTPTSLTPPAAPTEVTASAGNGSASVAWTAPANGGSPITGYTVTPYIGASAQTPREVSASTTSTTATGLANGTSYTFTVTATNALGNGPASEHSNAVTPATTPAAPTAVTASPGNASATVKWGAPANGGSQITGYTITPYVGAEAQTATTITGNPPATSATVTGLTNGTSYTFTVTATNALGNGPASEHSNAVTPATTPAAPTAVKASTGNASAAVSWTAPANGGSQITGYTITPYIGATAQTATKISGSPPATSTTITGLTNGTSYTFTVTATNALGTGPASEHSNAVTPTTVTVPGAPTAVTASAATRQALVSWTAPSSNGGSAITSYTLTPYIGSSAQTPLEVSASTTSAIITGLTNGTAYTFTVAASNVAGSGPASSASGAITPQDTIFDFATPATINSADAHSVDVGVKFTSEVAGSVTGIRFYKASTNTGTHIGSLWTAGGTLLASETFTSETASGWQQVNFAKPVPITASTTYVAAYLAPKGDYSDTSSGFASSPFSNPPLSALSNLSSVNGVYTYSATTTFPTSTYKATNYWVDVDFEPSH
ncbi:MAG: DUF4082 domain-containing protein [Solirubrobacteraceae bacterium]